MIQNSGGKECRIISIGSGNCELEIDLCKSLVDQGHSNFKLHCLEINSHMIERGKQHSKENGANDYIDFIQTDI